MWAAKRWTTSASSLPGSGLRNALRSGYGRDDLRADLTAGLVVGILAVPLSMALGIASGATPQAGLFTAVVAGALIALTGGSRTQVSGPTAAFVVLLVPIVVEHGIGGLMMATMMAGLMQLAMGYARLGQVVQLMPYPVIIGFTSGIAVVIASLQLPDALGIVLHERPEDFGHRIVLVAEAIGGLRWAEVAVTVGTLALIFGWPKVNGSIPAPLIALPTVTLAAWLVETNVPGVSITSLADRFPGGIPRDLPGFAPPWAQPGVDGAPLGLSVAVIEALIQPAIAIALLGAIESLLSAVIADAMTGDNHDPDGELIGQGLGNVIAPFFGGFAATGALARTAANARAGARSPIAAATHSAVVLGSMLLLAPLLAQVPMAAMAGLLLSVAWNLAEFRHFVHGLTHAPRSDAMVQVLCFLLTVLFDMVVAVTTGVALSAFLFIRRMAQVSELETVDAPTDLGEERLPKGVVLYRVRGPMFFGAAHKAFSVLQNIHAEVRVVILDLGAAPALDATALVNLESTLGKLERSGVTIILAQVNPQPIEAIDRAGWHETHPKLQRTRTVSEAIAKGRTIVEAAPAGQPHM